MFLYLSLYLLAAVMLFQGVNLLVEQGDPSGVVPPEVRPADAPASRWGSYLAMFGAVLAVVGILSHAYGWLAVVLAPLRNLGFASVAAYGLWLVFGRKVNYLPAPGSGSGSGNHGHAH
jgi:hypothetical protein